MTLFERFCGWLAWHLPRAVVYHCLIRAWAHGTTGQFGWTVAPSLSMEEALSRWGEPWRQMTPEENAAGLAASPDWPRDDMGREVET